MNTTKVSVIVPVKNAERFMESALRSIVDQAYEPIDIIVVDGRSTDRSVEIASSFEGVRVLQQRGFGLSDAWNTGIEAAEGDLIAFLDSDDVWVQGSLVRRVRHLMSNPKIAYTIAKATFFLEEGESIPIGFKPQLLDTVSVAPIPGTFLARRSVFETIGLFNKNLKIAADVDLIARLKDQDVPMAIFPELVLRKRVHGSNLSSDAKVGNRELLTVLRRSVGRQRANGDGDSRSVRA